MKLSKSICRGCLAAVVLLGLLASSCRRDAPNAPSAIAPQLLTNGAFQVTARLEEIPEGAIFKRDLYDYATVLKYRVLKVQRGELKAETIYVAQYNPWKARQEAADRRVPKIGGNLKTFQAGQIHSLALEAPVEDYFMGGLVNKYFGQTSSAIYWAVWTDLANE